MDLDIHVDIPALTLVLGEGSYHKRVDNHLADHPGAPPCINLQHSPPHHHDPDLPCSLALPAQHPYFSTPHFIVSQDRTLEIYKKTQPHTTTETRFGKLLACPSLDDVSNKQGRGDISAKRRAIKQASLRHGADSCAIASECPARGAFPFLLLLSHAMQSSIASAATLRKGNMPNVGLLKILES